MSPIDWNTIRAALDTLAGRKSVTAAPTPRAELPRFVPPPRVEPSMPEQPLDEFREFKWE
ncbi:MAG: hypothetical protein MUC96_19200 [Myxococcaceae bacterium]|jgi:hypothetical protein|nr:hypothetical protein [Myxococcaceae bacterium]